MSGRIAPGEKYVRAPLPIPRDGLRGKVDLKATFCFSTPTDPQHSGAYTRSGLEVVFRPNGERHKEDKANAPSRSFLNLREYSDERSRRPDAGKWPEGLEELRQDFLFGPNDPLFPKSKVMQDADKSFRAIGIEADHWSDASPVRAIFRGAFASVGLPYFPPHSLRHTLGHLMHTVCRTPREIKAWSQNLGHENVATTMTSYGKIDPHQQGEVIGAISLRPSEPEHDLLAKIRALVS